MWKVGRIEIAQKIYKTLCKLTIAFMLGLWYSIIAQRAKNKNRRNKNMKVKDFPNWCKVVFNDRTLLKSDLCYMSWQQIRALDEMEVILAEDNGKTLVLENQ